LRLLQFEIEALDNLQELANLIWLRVTMHILDIYRHRDGRMDINVMTSFPASKPKTERLKEKDDLREPG